MGRVEWRAKRQPSGTVDTDLADVRPVRDAVNRFARSATAVFLDPGGTKKSNYDRGQRVEFEVSTDGGSSWTRRFAGTVFENSRVSSGNRLEVEVLSYDHFLRRKPTYDNYSSKSISTILNDLVTTHTPINWNASKVSVTNDQSISRDFQGERIDEAIQELASMSADEQFGVDNDFEFFFEDQETGDAPDDVLSGEWTRYDLPERGKKAVNRVRVFWGAAGNRNAVIVKDPNDQLELKNDLNAPRAVELEETVTFPEIGSEDAAKRKGEQILSERSVVQTGTVTTWDRFDVEPGDVFRLEIPERSIDADYRVAEIEYHWREDKTILTIAENVGDAEDLLVGLSDDVKRISARDADPTVTPTEFQPFTSGVTATVTSTVIQRTIDDANTFIAGITRDQAGITRDQAGFAFSNRTETTQTEAIATASLLNACRDVWQGESAPGISHIAVGTDNTQPSRQQSSLGAEADRTDTDQFGASGSVDAFAEATFDAGGALAGSDITEAGLFDAASGGSMYERTTFSSVSHDSTSVTIVRMTVTFDVDSELRGVITSKGQERLRDLLIGETGHDPDEMVYGTGTTSATESDTSLENRQHADTIDSTADRSTGITDIVERIGSAEATTTNFSEVGYENSSNELLSRIVFNAPDQDVVLETNYRFQASNP